jgi:NAD(P)-dependent dehydrogenase (short-subunit alcohol dehydrogenase family)
MAITQPLHFTERVVIITGAGSGLGREYALQFARRGARVVVNGRSEGNILETVEAIRAEGGQAVPCVVDITSEGAGERVVAKAIEEWDRIDSLVNNAGAGHGGALGSFTSEDFEVELAVSLKASVTLSHAAWPHLVQSGVGRVVNTSSSTIFGTPTAIPYISAKAAIVGLTRGMAIDGAEAGIRVNAIMPLASTPMNTSLPDKEISRQFREHLPVDKAAGLVLLLSHEKAPVTGETFVTGGGFSARVSLAMGSGVIPKDPSPEGLLERFDEVMSLDGATAPNTSGSVREQIIRSLSPDAQMPRDD